MCRFANEALTASYVQITLSIDPVGAHGDGWLAEMKRLMPLLGKKHGLTLCVDVGMPVCWLACADYVLSWLAQVLDWGQLYHHGRH